MPQSNFVLSENCCLTTTETLPEENLELLSGLIWHWNSKKKRQYILVFLCSYLCVKWNFFCCFVSLCFLWYSLSHCIKKTMISLTLKQQTFKIIKFRLREELSVKVWLDRDYWTPDTVHKYLSRKTVVMLWIVYIFS